MIIEDNDIKFAESIFLPDGEKFDKERIDIIKSLVSSDVIACPGSGKTTVLLAKLAILDKYLPLENNQGICVLTHTNVGIDEIKERLGNDSSKLFAYPNFFGTIQSFVNRFLAIPYFENAYGHKVQGIDNNRYNIEVIRAFYTLPYGVQFGFSEKYKEYDLLAKIQNLRLDLNDDRIVDGIVGNKLYKTVNKTEKALVNMKKKIMQEGVLCFDDAYWLAYKLLEEDKNLIKSLISRRFAYVFVDEMQDTANHQAQIFSNVFDEHDVVIQKFGDPNQAIYNSINAQENGWVIRDKILPISNSMRFSNSMAQKVKPLELHSTEMTGNSDLEDSVPIIISFTESSITDVIPKFAQIINEKLQISPNMKFKAVGRVGKKKDNGDLSIPNYYPHYHKKNSSLLYHMRFSRTVCKKAIDPDNKCEVRIYKKAIVDAVLKVLWLLSLKNENDKYFTDSTFRVFLLETNKELYDMLYRNILKWCIDLKNDCDIKVEFRDFIVELVNVIFNVSDIKSLDKYFEDNDSGEEVEKSNDNIYRYEYDDGKEIEIEISSVHGVKGETHSATLYLETFFYKNDIEEVIEYLKGSQKKKTGKRLLETCKLAYVGMSRPSDLLCIAARKDIIDQHKENLTEIGWEIVEI